MAAVAEALARAAVTGADPQLTLTLGLLALATTLPLAFLRPSAAAMAVTVAAVLSLALFGSLTVAGLVAELAALYRLGSLGAQGRSAQVLASVLAVPFLVVALTGPRPTSSEAAVLALLAAALAPAAGWIGFARRARQEATTQSAAREVIAGSLVEHTARGER
ncbi:MAG TPA: hypothetical protein VKW77_02000, partial [Acidimicrobiales bacterium]|nr:hypothetical protein [Acidimicrobiales bacterium]